MQTILIIDDEPGLRQSLAMILQRQGYLVTTAAQAEEARHLLLAGPFDLAIVDLRMPAVDGLTLLDEIHDRYPEMPVFILTAYASLKSAIEAMRRGARDYLLKPVEPEVLVTRVQEVFATQARPYRRREIATQLQQLIGELHGLDNNRAGPEPLPAEPPPDPSRYLQRGTLTLDLHTHRIMLEDRQIPLPPSVSAYLVTLMRHAPDPVPYDVLVKESQGYEVVGKEAREIARRQVHELRGALEGDTRHPHYIITVRDYGYRFVS